MIKRESYIAKIRPFIGSDLIKVLTGIRRCGKSCMLLLIQEELLRMGISPKQILNFNFESFAYAEFKTAISLYKELARKIKEIQGKAYIFLDEIQEVEDWEKCINSLRVDFDCDIYITGSNAKLLSGELATFLAGRYIEFNIFPFSFAEFLKARGTRNLKIKEEFLNYLNFGGMPVIINFIDNQDNIGQYLKDLYNSVVLKDIIMRNKIRDVDLLERIISYIILNIGQPFSARSISNYFKSENRKVSPETVMNYLTACVNSFLIYKFKREDIVGKKILSTNEKYYLADHGIREVIFSGNQKDINLILENIVAMEFLRRGYNLTIGKIGEQEIDFIAKKAKDIIYVQVAYLLATPEVINREFRVFKNVADNFPKLVISYDDFDMSREGIKHFNICDFLLAEKWF